MSTQRNKTVKTVKNETVKNQNLEIEKIESEILENKDLKIDLLNINLDEINFSSILNDSEKMKNISEKSEKNKTSIQKFELYAYKTDKAQRQKLRNQLKKYTLNIYSVLNSKDENQIKSFISEFLKFYKENYRLNDFSLISLSYNNRDKDTEERITEFLKLFKSLISK